MVTKFVNIFDSSILQIPGESTLKRNFQQIQERESRSSNQARHAQQRQHERQRHHHPRPQSSHQQPPPPQPHRPPSSHYVPHANQPPSVLANAQDQIPKQFPVQSRLIGGFLALIHFMEL